MTHTADPVARSLELRPGKFVVLPLKADRIQLAIFVIETPNRPYDFAAETEAERNARLEAGWRRHTVEASWRSRHAA